MKSKYILIPVITIIVLVVVFALLAVATMAPVTSPLDRQKPANITFGYKDKNPYGGYVAYHWLQKLWHDETPSVITKPFASAYTHNSDMKNSGNVYVILAKHSFTDAADIRAMESFVSDGNTLVMGICQPDSLLQQAFGFQVADSALRINYDSAVVQKFVSPRLDNEKEFAYKGFYCPNYFISVDSSVTSVMGVNGDDKPNFISVTKGDGHLILFLNPMVMTNYFLLHRNNSQVMENILTYVPDYTVTTPIFWDEFYKNQTIPRSGDFSEWQVLMRYPAMRWAFWLTLLTALFYVAFESKRRQRIIPDIAPLTNTSAEFVTTLGKLYYQHHDNKNLASKMVQHLLEYIRTRYHLNTQHLNEEFAEHLAGKSGYPVEQTRELIQYVHLTRLEMELSDQQLHAFYLSTYQFYQNT